MKTRVLALAAAACLVSPPAFAQAPTTLAAAPAATLAKAVDIPFKTFTLPNGLRVVVHTDRKAPIVAVSVWYDVGSKHEPAGRSGFAHLFEHLMFNGSENAPGDFFEPLKQVGATDYNGTTSFDRTNYFENVPTAALDRALFLESDRMGHLLGAITQGVLDEQRGVVQNEKRQGDNQPYGLVQYRLYERLFAGTPYGHLPIGSMADLDRASLDDVKSWFRSHYGPNNAVLVLAGDIDVATAKAKVARYFGAIPRGPESPLPTMTVPTLAAPVNDTMSDRVAATLIVRSWAVPGLNDPDAPALDVGGAVLGGLAASRLETALMRQEKIATQASASYSDMAQVGMFSITVVVKPGIDPALVNRRVDAILADLMRTGPTADEVGRVVTTSVAARIRGLEQVGGRGGKAAALAQGALYSGDPARYKKELAAIARQTPASVKVAMNRWLSRPAYTLTVSNGNRGAYAEAVVPPKVDVAPAPETPVVGNRGPLPPVGEPTGLTFPRIERTRLSNGIELIYAHRTAVPMTRVALSFDAGVAADVADRLGTQQLTLGLLDEGTATRDAIGIAEARQRLGAAIGTGVSPDRTTVSLDVPSANLQPGLELFADIVRNPAFPQSEVERAKQQQLAGIAQELTSPDGIAGRVLPRYQYPEGSPYRKATGGGDPAAVATLTRADLVAFQQAWLRPDKAKVFVVSDRPLNEVRAALDVRFGGWVPTAAAGAKAFPARGVDRTDAKVVLVDRPDSPQSLIYGVQRTDLPGTVELLPYSVANDALGGSFLGRINMDLRETRHWSYGASGSFSRQLQSVAYVLRAPVQADQTGPSIASMRTEVANYLGPKPMTEAEFSRAVTGGIRALPGSFESSLSVLAAMQQNDLLGRPDDYYSTIAQRYAALTLPEVGQAIRSVIEPSRTTWVVVGDARTVRGQLDTLGLPVEVVPVASVTGRPAVPASAATAK